MEEVSCRIYGRKTRYSALVSSKTLNSVGSIGRVQNCFFSLWDPKVGPRTVQFSTRICLDTFTISFSRCMMQSMVYDVVHLLAQGVSAFGRQCQQIDLLQQQLPMYSEPDVPGACPSEASEQLCSHDSLTSLGLKSPSYGGASLPGGYCSTSQMVTFSFPKRVMVVVQSL